MAGPAGPRATPMQCLSASEILRHFCSVLISSFYTHPLSLVSNWSTFKWSWTFEGKLLFSELKPPISLLRSNWFNVANEYVSARLSFRGASKGVRSFNAMQVTGFYSMNSHSLPRQGDKPPCFGAYEVNSTNSTNALNDQKGTSK